MPSIPLELRPSGSDPGGGVSAKAVMEKSAMSVAPIVERYA
jgi:hypothetical protein